MNILDLLVVERYTTNQSVAENIVGEVGMPLGDLTRQLQALRTERADDAIVRQGIDQALRTIERARERLQSCTAGPRRRRWASRKGREPRLRRRPEYSSPMFIPPVKPTLPSTTMSFRWLRRCTAQRRRSGFTGRKTSAWPPALRIRSSRCASMWKEPTPS